jgi:uncharacterized RDD family membrane protein YckC
MIPAMERDDLRTRGAFVGALDVRIDPFLASAGSRSLAAIVDTLIVLLIISFVLALLTLAGPLLGQMATGTMASIAALVVFLAQWFYFVACEQLMGGQSPGKRICGLRVVMDDGTAPGLLASLIRNLLRPIDLMPAFYGVGVVTLFLNDRGKRVGDLAAGTIVVREAKTDAGASPPTPTRWPERLDADDVRLVEGYFRAAETMADGPREEAARLLVEWIRREHAAFAEGVDTQLAWSRQAQLIFGVTPSARTG